MMPQSAGVCRDSFCHWTKIGPQKIGKLFVNIEAGIAKGLADRGSDGRAVFEVNGLKLETGLIFGFPPAHVFQGTISKIFRADEHEELGVGPEHHVEISSGGECLLDSGNAGSIKGIDTAADQSALKIIESAADEERFAHCHQGDTVPERGRLPVLSGRRSRGV